MFKPVFPFFATCGTAATLISAGCQSNAVAPPVSNNAASLAQNAARAIVDKATGNARGARNDARDLKRQSDALLAAKNYHGAMAVRWQMMGIRGKDVSPLGALTGMAIQALALSDLEPIASRLDGPACRNFAAQLETLDKRSPSYAEILKSKEASELKFFRQMLRDPADWQKTIAQLFKPQEQQILNNTSPAQIEANIQAVYAAAIANAQSAYSTPAKTVPADPYTTRYASPLKLQKFLVARYQTDRRLVIAALRTRFEKLEKQAFDGEFPRDPFGSGPLKTKNGAIYSIGPDLKDDGGRAIPLAETRRQTARGDIPAPRF